jgi:glycosyltransferase involved in cell wall biosynthesis
MRVAVVIDSVPNYRRGFYRRVLASSDVDLTVYCQSQIKGFNLQLIHKELGANFIEVPFISTGNHSVAWQRLPVRQLWKNFDVYFFHGNPRIVSTLVWATLFRLLGKKVIIWGQAHTAGANAATEAIRLVWWRLFKNQLVYTEAEVEYLRQRRFHKQRIVGMSNGLDQNHIERVKESWDTARLTAWQEKNGLTGKTVILSCARLIEKNCFHLMIEGLPRLVETRPDLLWCVIGNGSAQAELNRKAKQLGVADHIVWVGELYGEEDLAPWFMSSRFLVHPGAIGLTLMHAFGYGLPVVTHDNIDFQMPEIAAFEDGVNGCYFRENDTASLLDTISSLLDDPDRATRMSEAALDTVRSRFNTDIMAERFIGIAQQAAND